jgi:RNA polymerase sigma-70 factor (ECF subfamily)
MTPQEDEARLSRIETRWTVVFQAHQQQGGAADAQQALVLRYHRAVFRYLRAMVKDADVAEDLSQEFVLRFLTGEFRRAHPTRGRFRDFLKRALRNMVIDFWRRKRVEQEKVLFRLHGGLRGTPPGGDRGRRPVQGLGSADPHDDPVKADRTFQQGWRAEMLARAWEALARFQDRTRHAYHTVLLSRANNPQGRTAELARLLSICLGKPVTEAAFRQLLCRAREKFADFLVAEVACSLESSDPDAIETELIELDLLFCCQQSVARRRGSHLLERGGAQTK